jgi:uncharacterized glyoxalase superfamily protein PhnB
MTRRTLVVDTSSKVIVVGCSDRRGEVGARQDPAQREVARPVQPVQQRCQAMPSLPWARRAFLWHVIAVMRANRSIPSSTVIPELGYADVDEASDWLCAAFGFTVRLRIASHRIQLNVGDGAVVATELAAPAVDRAHSVMIRVEDVDGHHTRAVAHGARIVRAPADHPFGERQYTAEDPGGHVWTFSQSIADVSPEDWGGTSGQL